MAGLAISQRSKLKRIYPHSWQWISLARRIPGQLTERESNLLFLLALMRTSTLEPVIVELGAGRGQASVLLAAGLSGKIRPRLVSLPRAGADPMDEQCWHRNLQRCGLGHIAESGSASVVASIDILFVNAAPDSELLRHDLSLWATFVKSGGLVVLYGVSPVAAADNLPQAQYRDPRQVDNLTWAAKQCAGPSSAAPATSGGEQDAVAIAAARLQDYVRRAAREVAEDRHAVQALRASWSWRLTAPLRWAVETIQSVAGLIASFRDGSFKARISGLSQWIRFGNDIRSSGLLDEGYYREQNAGVALAAANPLLHFLVCGASEGRNPNELFDLEYYVARYPDVADSRVNPLFHYLRHGADEGRDPHPHFDTRFYLERNPDVCEAGLNPLAHYLAPGIAEGRDPNPWFDTSEYLEQNPEVATFGLNPLTHQLTQVGLERSHRACSQR